MEQPPCMGASEYIKIFCELSLSFSVNLKLLYKLSDLKIRFITQAYTSCTNSLIKKKKIILVLLSVLFFSPEGFLKFMSQSLF